MSSSYKTSDYMKPSSSAQENVNFSKNHAVKSKSKSPVSKTLSKSSGSEKSNDTKSSYMKSIRQKSYSYLETTNESIYEGLPIKMTKLAINSPKRYHSLKHDRRKPSHIHVSPSFEDDKQRMVMYWLMDQKQEYGLDIPGIGRPLDEPDILPSPVKSSSSSASALSSLSKTDKAVQCCSKDIKTEMHQTKNYYRFLNDIIEDDEEPGKVLENSDFEQKEFKELNILSKDINLKSTILDDNNGKKSDENESEKKSSSTDDDLEKAMAASMSSIKSHEILSRMADELDEDIHDKDDPTTSLMTTDTVPSEIDFYRRASYLESYALEKLKQLNMSEKTNQAVANKKKPINYLKGLYCCHALQESEIHSSQASFQRSKTSLETIPIKSFDFDMMPSTSSNASSKMKLEDYRSNSLNRKDKPARNEVKKFHTMDRGSFKSQEHVNRDKSDRNLSLKLNFLKDTDLESPRTRMKEKPRESLASRNVTPSKKPSLPLSEQSRKFLSSIPSTSQESSSKRSTTIPIAKVSISSTKPVVQSNPTTKIPQPKKIPTTTKPSLVKPKIRKNSLPKETSDIKDIPASASTSATQSKIPKSNASTYSSGLGSDDYSVYYGSPKILDKKLDVEKFAGCSNPEMFKNEKLRIIRNRGSFSASSGYESAEYGKYQSNDLTAKLNIIKKLLEKKNNDISNRSHEVIDLFQKREKLKKQLIEAKLRIGSNKNEINDLKTEDVSRFNDLPDETVTEILNQEIKIFEKRILACQNHIMIETSFL